jgi:hypothetical protein
MPSSQSMRLSADTMEKLVHQLNILFKSVFNLLDYAIGLDGKGITTSLAYGGLGKDVSAWDGLVGISGGDSHEVTIGAGLTLSAGNDLSVSFAAGALDDLSDVAISSVQNRDVLSYDSSIAMWKNRDVDSFIMAMSIVMG